MLKKIKKRKLYIFLIILIVGVLISVFYGLLGVRIAGRSKEYLDEYKEYYLYKKDYKPILDFNFGAKVDKGYKVGFLPGQKRNLLKKIKEDVNAELTNLVDINSGVLIKYEISDDFKKINIYYYKGEKEEINYSNFNAESIASKVELYHQLIHGYANTSFDSYIFNYIEVE